MALDPHLLTLYLVAATVLVIAPGPDSLLVLSRGVTGGRRTGIIATVGITVGNVIHASLAAAGISALIAASPMLFDVLRYAGAGYLVWIGVQSLRAAWAARRAGATPAMPPPPPGARAVFVQALGTNLLNPKVILFQLAFVPQFVAPDLGHVAAQTFILGVILAAMGFVYLCAVAAAGAKAARAILASRTLRAGLDALAGVLFLGFAVRLLLTERRIA